MLEPAAVEFIQSGVAVGVATCDDELTPSFSRGWGPEVSGDGRSLRLCVAAPAGSPMRSNLEENAAIAVGFSPPTIAQALQVKGAAAVVCEPDADDLARAEQHRRLFEAECARIGAPAEVSQRMFVGERLVAVEISIAEVYDQTPGPTAGRRL